MEEIDQIIGMLKSSNDKDIILAAAILQNNNTIISYHTFFQEKLHTYNWVMRPEEQYNRYSDNLTIRVKNHQSGQRYTAYHTRIVP